MKRNILRISLFIATIISLSTIKVNAQTVNISAIIRPRLELQDGYRFPPDTGAVPQVLASQRTRLNASYNSDKVIAFLSIQDARVWGDEAIATDNPSVGIHEAWAQYNFTSHVGLKVGRQELVYDNKRYLTDGMWIQQGRAWDAATLKINCHSGWKVDAVGSYNQQVDNYYGDVYLGANPKSLDLLWINKSRTDSVHQHKYNVSGMFMADGYQSPDTTGIIFRYTFGLNTSFDFHNWGINLEGYGQSGKTPAINNGSGKPINDSFSTVKAYMFSVNPWVIPVKNLQIGVGIDYLSGTDVFDSSNVGTTNMFNFQYGAAHRYYGKMDMFFQLPAGTHNGGLIDIYLNANYNYRGWAFAPEFHHFSLQNNVEDVENPGQALDKNLGSELDLIFIKDLTKAVNLNTGFCMFFPTRSMEFVKSSAFSQVGTPPIMGYWFYVMLTFHPVFFSK